MAKNITVGYSVLGIPQWRRQIRAVKDSVKSMKPGFELIAKDFYETEKSQFAGSGSFEGNKPWVGLSDIYKAWKDRHFPGQPILTLHGNLRDSLTKKGAPGNIHRISDMSFEIGTGIEYAIYHQKGTSKMLPRPPIWLTEAEKRRWGALLKRSLGKRIMKAGRQKYAPPKA